MLTVLVCPVAHPLIHLAYAFEMDSKDIAMEALAMACCCYNDMHKYLDDSKYTRSSNISSSSPSELLARISNDSRFDGASTDLASTNSTIANLLADFEDPIMDYWNAWDFEDPVKALEAAQDAAVAVLIGSATPKSPFNFFFAHILTSSHAMRVLLPLIPADRQVSMLRQWWLLTIAIYIFRDRPVIDSKNINDSLDGHDWAYVEDKTINSERCTEAHFVKGKTSHHTLCTPVVTINANNFTVVRSLKEAEKTWGSKDNLYLLAACTFVDNYKSWAF